MNDAEMEAKYKREGWEIYRNGSSPSDRARGVFAVIESHFYRNSKAQSLAAYASHWLWANHHRYDKQVMVLLIEQFPLPGHPRIQRGYSDWDSYGNPLYAIQRS